MHQASCRREAQNAPKTLAVPSVPASRLLSQVRPYARKDHLQVACTGHHHLRLKAARQVGISITFRIDCLTVHDVVRQEFQYVSINGTSVALQAAARSYAHLVIFLGPGQLRTCTPSSRLAFLRISGWLGSRHSKRSRPAEFPISLLSVAAGQWGPCPSRCTTVDIAGPAAAYRLLSVPCFST